LLLGLLLWAGGVAAAFWAQYQLTGLRLIERGGWFYLLAAVAGSLGVWIIDRRAPPAPPPIEPPVETPPIRWFASRTTLATTLAAVSIAFVALSVQRLSSSASYREAFYAWLAAMILLPVAALLGGRPVPANRGWRWDVLAVLGLVAVAVALRLPHLEQIPPEVHGDEAACGLEARSILAGQVPNIFSVGWYHIPYLSFAISAAVMRVFGNDLWGFRMASVIQGTASVVLLYLLASRLFSRRVGAMAAFLLAVSHWHIHFSRSGINYIQALIATLLVLYFVVRATQERRAFDWILAGFSVGLCINVYYAARLAPVLAALYLLHRILFERGFLRRQWIGMATMSLAAILFFAPMGVVFLQIPRALMTRTQGVFLLSPASLDHSYYTYGTNSLQDVLREQIERTVLAFNLRGETSLQHNHKAPLLDFWSGALFVVGLAAFGLRFHRSPFFLVGIWFWLTMALGSVLTIDAMFSPRVIGAVPVIFLFPALVVDAGWRGFERLGGRIATWLFVVPVLAFLGLSARANYDDYFRLHIGQLQSAGINTTLARYVDSINDRYQVWVLGSISLRYDTERFLIPNVDGVDVADSPLPLPLDRIPAKKGVAFLVAYAEPKGAAQIAEIREAYPKGQTTVLKTPIDIPVFHVHRVEHDDLVAANPQATLDEKPINGLRLAELARRGMHHVRPRPPKPGATPAPEPPQQVVLPHGSNKPWMVLPGMEELLDVAVGPKGDIFAVDRVTRRVEHVGAEGERIGTIRDPVNLQDPRALALGPDGNLYVLESSANEVIVYTPAGLRLRDIALPGGGYFPSSLTVDAAGAVLVADTGRSRVVRIAPDGSNRIVGGGSDSRAVLDQPTDVAVTAAGEILVADGVKPRVVVFGPDLAYRREWAVPATPVFPGRHLLVTGDSVIVSVPDQQRVVRYTLDGRELGDIGAGQMVQPVGLAVDAGGTTLHVADAKAQGIYRFTLPTPGT
jgi:DNA-binding beta-propeller fold protein YncE/4-amino-4-deoxy-L-arabinose transferase-like glycosyltransferase